MTTFINVVLAMCVFLWVASCSSGQTQRAPPCEPDVWSVSDCEERFCEAFKNLPATKQGVTNVGYVVVLPRTSMRVGRPYVIASSNTSDRLVIGKSRTGDERGEEILLRSDEALRYFGKCAGSKEAPLDPGRGQVSYFVLLFDKSKKIISVACISEKEFDAAPDVDKAIDNEGALISSDKGMSVPILGPYHSSNQPKEAKEAGAGRNEEKLAPCHNAQP